MGIARRFCTMHVSHPYDKLMDISPISADGDVIVESICSDCLGKLHEYSRMGVAHCGKSGDYDNSLLITDQTSSVKVEITEYDEVIG